MSVADKKVLNLLGDPKEIHVLMRLPLYLMRGFLSWIGYINIVLDLQSLFQLLCTAVLIG